MLGVIYRHVVHRGSAHVMEPLWSLQWGWVVAAVAMQLCAVSCAALRWRVLLKGQGIHPSGRFLFVSILIARFWGAFTPGGFTGFGGWRIYDVARHTGKTARAAATIGVEVVLGQMAFGLVVMASSVFGFRYIGWSGVLLVNVLFSAVIVTGLTLLARPAIFRWVADAVPSPAAVKTRVRSLVDAVCAYRGQGRLLGQALLCGVGIHVFNSLIYVCAARALAVDALSVPEVFFGASLTILATLLPTAINGIGLREVTALALYTQLGVPEVLALWIPDLGFAAEMLVSSAGGVLFMMRGGNYDPQIRVEDPDRESREAAPKASTSAGNKSTSESTTSEGALRCGP